jgi:uncharacterized protein YdhG (YjbR/CyaY superfamily)
MEQGSASVDEYIRSCPEPARKRLIELRALVRAAAPGAQERISYRMPAFFLGRNLVYFAAFAHHIGFYPGAGVVSAFKSRLSKYKNARGSVQFPHEEQLPIVLIRKMLKFKMEEMAGKHASPPSGRRSNHGGRTPQGGKRKPA